jgi:hypothetical protein
MSLLLIIIVVVLLFGGLGGGYYGYRGGYYDGGGFGGIGLIVLVLVQIGVSEGGVDTGPRLCPLYCADSTAFQTAAVLLSLRRSLPRLNCPLWIRRSSSMPAIVTAAVLNHLNPSIGPMRSLTPR